MEQPNNGNPYEPKIDEYSDEIWRYNQCIKEIKTRLLAIKKCGLNPGYFPNNLEVEFVALQLRCILELIVLSSLVTHSKHYNASYEELGKIWRIRPIMNKVESINPNYFPIAVSIGDVEPFELHNLKNEGNILTKDELQDIHNRLCDFAHPQNPFAKEKDYVAMWDSFADYARKVGNLMNIHLIQVVDVKVKFLVMSNFDNDLKPYIMFLTKD